MQGGERIVVYVSSVLCEVSLGNLIVVGQGI